MDQLIYLRINWLHVFLFLNRRILQWDMWQLCLNKTILSLFNSWLKICKKHLFYFRGKRHDICSKMGHSLNGIDLAIEKVYVHWGFFEDYLGVWLQLTDDAQAVLLAIVVEPAVLLLLLEIILASLGGETGHLCLFLEEPHELEDGDVLRVFVHALQLTCKGTVLLLEFEILQ